MGLLTRLAEAAKVLTRPDEEPEGEPVEGEVMEAEPEEKPDLAPRIGSAGQAYQGGLYSTEHHEDLDTLAKRVDEMAKLKRGDSVIAGQLRRRRIPVLRAEWSIEAGEELPKLPSELAAEQEAQAEEAEKAGVTDKPTSPGDGRAAVAPAPPKALADVETGKAKEGVAASPAPGKPRTTGAGRAPSGGDADSTTRKPLTTKEQGEADAADLARQDASAKLVRLFTANLLGKGPLPYRMATTWRQYVTESLTAEAFGFSLFERTLKLADGPWGSAVVIDGLWYMDPASLYEWHLDEAGQLGAITQMTTRAWWTYGDSKEELDQEAMLRELLKDPQNRSKLRTNTEYRHRTIPANRLIVHVMDREGSDYEGNATIRPAYMEAKHVAFLRMVQRVTAVKRGIPIPQVKLTTGFDPTTKANAEQVAKRMTMGGQERLYVTTTPGVEVGYVEMAGNGPDFNEDMRAAIRRIALLHGTEASLAGSEGAGGSYSAAQTQRKDTDLALEDLAEWVRESTQAQVIEPIAALNDAQATPPQLRVANVTTQPVADLSVAKDKGLITWTGKDEQQLRKVLRMAPLTDEELAQRQAEKDAAKEQMAEMAGKAPKPGAKGDGPPVAPPKPPSELRELAEPLRRKTWRPLTDHERTHVRLAEIDAEIDDFERDYVQAIRPLRDKLIRECAEKANVKGRLVSVPRERLTTRGLKRAMHRLAEQMREFGRDTARTEIQSQAMVMLDEPPPFDPFAGEKPKALKGVSTFSQELDEHLETVVGLNVNRILDQVIGAVVSRIDAHLSEGWTEDQSRAGAVRDVLDTSESVLREMGNKLAAHALNGGRGEVAEQAMESGVEIQAVRTEVLDDRTCGACEALDGLTVDLDSDEYEANMPPNGCDGGAYCRGTYTFVVKGR